LFGDRINQFSAEIDVDSRQFSTRRRGRCSQQTSSRPDAVESAPYFAAFVASSCSASVRAWAFEGSSEIFGPETVIAPLVRYGSISSSTIRWRSAPRGRWPRDQTRQFRNLIDEDQMLKS
jgi:hypothetical protein